MSDTNLSVPPPAPARPAAAPASRPPSGLPSPSESSASLSLDALMASEPQSQTPEEETNKQRRYQQYEDIYITRFAGEINLIRVAKDYRLDTMTGYYTSRPVTSEDWIPEALQEASAMSRVRSTIRIHTTESDLVEVVRNVRTKNTLPAELTRNLARKGQIVVLARPERETPMWRKVMHMIREGTMPVSSPLVTYTVHTAAFTDYDHVYCGIVTSGLGVIQVYHTTQPGDDLVSAELDMVKWLLENAPGGGRILVHHSSDAALRIWEQASVLAEQGGLDKLGESGQRLRQLVREAIHRRTQIDIGRHPVPVFAEFAKAAASHAFVGSAVL